MTLTPEQKQTVASWVAAGDSLSTVQKKLSAELQISMTYMDVRFLVDDLGLELKNAAPKADASDVGKAPAPQPPSPEPGAPEKKGFFDKAKEKLGLGRNEPADDMQTNLPEEDFADEADAPHGAVSVTVDKVTLLPGALASGTVVFPDGVSGKWIVDNYGRPGLTEISRPGYRPSPADGQAFMQELSAALEKRGM